MRSLKFSKMVATGNDFVVIDNRLNRLSRVPDLARRLCDRKLGIGADGLLLVEKSKMADFKMRILNPDGSEPEMCGNGSRCIALFAREKGVVRSSSMSIETKAGLLKAKVKGSLVSIKMTDPTDIKPGLNIEIGRDAYQLHFINTGVPHAVFFVRNLEMFDVDKIGSAIRYHKAFRPDGTNADFIKVKSKGSIWMRTYERGVEAETLACGTGAVASAIIAGIINGFGSPVKVYTKGGLLNIYFKKNKGVFRDVLLEGEAKEVFAGTAGLEV
ncbi:MAG: diaminopimelate epimerase [Candidatus Omnitrophica bacterium]|nr:diaminopimelate epimerase [Candidatus Omnitrophota bacterium]